ncbi:MAG: Ig-like domain-containing protein [Alcanivoracaceae bacterium]
MLKRIILPALVIGLIGCGGDTQKVTFHWEKARLEYSYPYDGQREVSMRAPAVLRFSHPLDAEADLGAIELLDSDNQPVPVARQILDDRRSVILTPQQALRPVHEYTVVAGELPTGLGVAEFPEDGVRFRTRGSRSGPRDHLTADSAFWVSRVIPDGNAFPVMDFSTLRLQFNEPLDVSSVRYGVAPGDTIALVNSADQLVPAVVRANSYYLTLDPVNDLLPDELYRIVTPGGLRSVLGSVLGEAALELEPQSSHPRATMVQRAADSLDGLIVSPLTGAPINAVPVNAVLLGDKSLSQQEGDVYAELAYIPNFPTTSPLRVPRGSLLSGTSVSVDIAGEVPAGFETGPISVTFVTDASGYMIPNPYTRHASSPRHVRLMMDLAMTAQEPQANGALSQDLLHVELYGTAMVEDGVLTINAIGVVEPEVLGLETAWGVLSFNMRALDDQRNAPPPAVDFDPPTLQSWLPGDQVAMATPGEPIILNFSEPLDPPSLHEPGALTLTLNGAPLPADIHLDGASVVIRPHDPIRHPRPGESANYQLVADAPLRDIAGNLLDQQHILDFSLPMYVDSDVRSPLPLAVYPGYPCETSGRSINLDGGPLATEHHGRCVGGGGSDDLLPLSRLPSNRPIRVQFSQDMDPASIALGGSFVVERRQGGSWVPVGGRLRVDARLLEFWPDQGWQPDQLYRYRLRSNGDRTSSAGSNCNGSQAICSLDGLPLQTRVLAQVYSDATASQGGGPDMVVLFRGAAATSSVMQALRKLPSIDANANMIHEPSHEAMPVPNGSGGYITPYNSTNLVARSPSASGLLFDQANVGCGFFNAGNWLFPNWQPTSCPEKRYIYLSGALNSEVVGYDPDEDAIRVNILPTVLYTTNLDSVVKLSGLASTLTGESEQAAPTGPQVMRLRYRHNPASGRRDLPIAGWIRETPGGPVLEATLNVYLDAPELHAEALGMDLGHNLFSLPLTMTISGPIEFLDDGRMHIVQTNTSAVDVTVVITALGFLNNNINLRIPPGGVNLSLISEAVK